MKNKSIYDAGLSLYKFLLSRDKAFAHAKQNKYISVSNYTDYMLRLHDLRRIVRPLILNQTTERYNVQQVVKYGPQFLFMAKRNCKKQEDAVNADLEVLRSFLENTKRK